MSSYQAGDHCSRTFGQTFSMSGPTHSTLGSLCELPIQQHSPQRMSTTKKNMRCPKTAQGVTFAWLVRACSSEVNCRPVRQGSPSHSGGACHLNRSSSPKIVPESKYLRNFVPHSTACSKALLTPVLLQIMNTQGQSATCCLF